MKTELRKLNRFTTLPFVMDLVQRKTLCLVNPSLWEDYNDRATLEVFLQKSKAKSIYALCLTHQSETIHHWNAFANGTSGCCIEFSPEKLFAILAKYKEVKHGQTQYVRMKDLSDLKKEAQQLPFVKRHPFKNENEYRIIAVSDKPQTATFDINIDLSVIRRITISNKVPEPVFDSIKNALVQLAPELKRKISHSTLYNNSVWIKHFNT